MRSNSFSPNFRVLILAPTIKDAHVTAAILTQQSINSFICSTINQICEEITIGADAAIITEEAILFDKDHYLENTLKDQPPWSDFPLIVLTLAQKQSLKVMEILHATGNMTMIARPLQIGELISTVQSALRDRTRQYQLRDYLIESKKNEKTIKDAQQRLQTALQAGHMGTWELDLFTYKFTCSSTCKANYGYEADFNFSYQDLINSIHTEDKVQWKKIVQQAIENQNDFEIECRVVWPDGSIHWIYTRGAYFIYGTGNSAHMSGISIDISDKKYAEISTLEAKAAAEKANMAKTEFLTNISHEIRTPMNAVMGLANILARSEPLTEKQRKFISTLQTSANSLLALINDLLDIAKIESQALDIEQVPFSMTQLIEEVMNMISFRAQEKKLSFTCDMVSIVGQIFIGDPTRIRQIILNLCSNAVKFTEEGGIHIGVKLQLDRKSDTVLISISVEDTGIGIASDKIPIIFDKFVQEDSSINRKYGGTGLGLAITKTLVEVMGGSLKVESIQGQGSIFTIDLPLKVEREFKIEENNQIPLDKIIYSNEPIKILLVEDYAANVLVAKTFLEQFGYVCEVASNGIEAIEKVRKGSFAAILMDIQMHGMDGLEATKFIREYEEYKQLPHLPIIGMTAHALSGDRERCLAAGMNDYIAKPFNPKELEKMLEGLLKV
ncbi:MAG: response regulator [Alphaproteobacteria bacterium]|nr:response regulator [Alphaproteobacteria bacterium]